ncbi:MAG TPA: CPBP family intramembrane glutamic endopeptidase [Candidatus Acidoferrum sp.]|nr:CPBP family intramembrane glutamic endopeptidase [Candidatus Acidoferrum sp.]
MSGDRLTSSEKRALLLWVAAGIIGLLFAHKYFFQAFPEASVNFQVSREEALARAQKFVTGLGENLIGYKSSIIFDLDEDAKVYLERQLGLREANRLMSSELNIWYWEVRFFKPLQEEEFEVHVSPSGQIVSYDHKIEEARAGASLERGLAQSAAQDFLTAKLGMNLRSWDALSEEANSKKKPNRTDWTFTWEKHGFRAKDAPYRLQVTMQGDRVGRSEEILKVPEAWERSFQRLRSANDTLELVFVVLYIALLAVAVWFGIKLTLQGQTRWRGAILLGLLAAALLFLQSLNEWPLWSASYDTKVSYATFLAGKVGSAILFAVLSALTITLVLPGAEPLYRSSWPERLRLSKTFTLRGLRSKEFFSASVVGLSLAAVHIGYVVGFYVLANWLGAWAPQEVNYQESVNTLFPWISGAAIGLLAATNEEFTFRLFAIPFFTKFTKSRWLAVIVPAFLWSFLHSNYPQEPAYVRGIEIGLIGIVAGVVMLRWGILATLIWHYTVDASLVGLFLLRSNSLYFKVSGAVVAAAAFAPLLFAGISCLARGGFEAGEDLRNSATPPPNLDLALAQPSSTSAVATRRYNALAPGMIAFLGVCLLAGGLLVWRLKPESIGDYLKLSVDAKTVRANADQALRGRGADPRSYKCAVVFADVVDPVTNEFLRERVGIARVNEIYDKQVPGALWQARYFRDGQPEEYAIKLKPDGSLFALQHKIAEDAPGVSLKKEEAVVRAEKYLREVKKMDLSQWTLVETDSETRPHRVDHLLTWQLNRPIDSNVSPPSDASSHAYLRVRVAVLGDEVTDYRRSYFPRSGSADEDEPASEGFSTFIKIPDDWRRKREEATLPREALTFGPIVLLVGLGLTVLIIFFKNLRSEVARAIPWKRLSLWAAWGLGAFYVFFALSDRIPNTLNLYNTAVPFNTTLGILGIFALLGGPFNFGVLVLLFGVAWYYAKLAFGEDALTGWAGMPGKYYRDALWIGLGGSSVLLGLERFLAVASTHWPTVHRYLDVSFGQDFDAVFPAASIVGGTLLGSLKMTAYVAVIASFVAARIKQAWLRLLLFLVGVLAVVGGGWGNPADFAKQFLAQIILLGVLVFGVRFVMRFNVLGCFLVVAGTSLVTGAAELLAQPVAFYRTNGYAVLLVLALLFAWPLAAWRFNSMQVTGPSAAPTGNS